MTRARVARDGAKPRSVLLPAQAINGRTNSIILWHDHRRDVGTA
jgi:hypothetical protein